MNNIPIKKRLKELLVDYVVIIAYLVLLLIINVWIMFFILKEIPEYTETQSQLIATFTSVIPVILIFSYLDYKGGSIGKRAAGLKLTFAHHRVRSSIFRNVIKFLPWQLGHVGVIHGMYSGFDMAAIILANGGTLLGFVLLCMGFFRKDKRHVGDFLAGTKVELS